MATFRTMSTARKAMVGLMGALGVGGTGILIALDRSVRAGEMQAHPPSYPWSHNGLFSALDAASMRRGYEVYKKVCSACHSLKYFKYMQLVNITHSEIEAKQEAAEIEVEDGPDDEGNMFMRPGKLSDFFPKPYPNDNAARVANSGALPPDLTLIAAARHGGEDYIFSLLTGYREAPEGYKLGEDLHYNPYFAGGAIGMTPPLYNEIIEYDDGTPASLSQLAKDVSVFLRFTSEPFHDDRKKMAIKCLMVLGVLTAISVYLKKHKWTVIKNRKFAFKPKQYKED